MNLPLFGIVFTIAFTVIIGILFVITVVTGFAQGSYVIGAIVIGAVLSLPISLAVTKRIGSLKSGVWRSLITHTIKMNKHRALSSKTNARCFLVGAKFAKLSKTVRRAAWLYGFGGDLILVGIKIATKKTAIAYRLLFLKIII